MRQWGRQVSLKLSSGRLANDSKAKRPMRPGLSNVFRRFDCCETGKLFAVQPAAVRRMGASTLQAFGGDSTVTFCNVLKCHNVKTIKMPSQNEYICAARNRLKNKRQWP